MLYYTLQDSGLVIVSSEEGVISLSKCSDLSDISVSPAGASLISQEAAEILNKAGEGTLGKSNQVTVPASKQNIVDHVDSVVDGKVDDGASKVTDQTNVSVHADDKNRLRKEMVDNSDLKEQTVTQISNDKANKVMIETANETDVNSNNVKQDLNVVSQNGAPDINENLDSKLDDSNNSANIVHVDSGIKIELDLLADSQDTDRTDNTDGEDTHGLSKSMVARLARMTDKPDYKQGICTSISFESDVTYHRESEDELLDNDETEDLDKIDKQNKARDKVDRTKVTNLQEEEKSEDIMAKSKEIGSPTAKVRFKIGEGKMGESASGVGGYVPGTDQFMDELHFRAYGKTDMLPVESVDDVSSMVVDYDPNENFSISTGFGDFTDDRYEDFRSNPDSGDEESELRAKAKIDLEYATGASVKPVSDEFADALAGSYGLRKPDNLYPVASVDDIGSMIVCYDPNETVSVGDITDSRLGEFESNANSSEDEDERKGGAGKEMTANVSENPKVLSLADRPGLVGITGHDPRRFPDASQSCDDVSSMMVEYDQSETVSVSDATDMFENVDNDDMTEDNVRRKDYVPGNFNTIGNWVRSVSRDETANQNVEDRSESDSGDSDHNRDGGETQLERFARKYVNDIIQDASDIVCGAPTENNTESGSIQDADLNDGKGVKAKDVFGHDNSMIMGEPLNISTPSKKDVSEDVMPLERPCDRSSVDIVSPITHVTEQETNEDVEFFSYKLQTQASVVLSSTGKSDSGDVALEEKDEPMSPVLPDISGYGVCVSGEGLEEMEKYYKEMAAMSEMVKKLGVADRGDLELEVIATDQLESLAASGSPAKDDVFFDAKETAEETEDSKGRIKNEKGESKEEHPHGDTAALEEHVVGDTTVDEESASKTEFPVGDTEVVKDPDNKNNKDPGSLSIIDDWAKQDYEAAAGHSSEAHEEEMDKLTDETKGTCSSTDTLDTESDKHTSAEGSDATKERNAPSSKEDHGAVSKRKKSKKHGKEERPSSNGAEKHSLSAEADSEHHGRIGSHSKKKKDAKDENCSVS